MAYATVTDADAVAGAGYVSPQFRATMLDYVAAKNVFDPAALQFSAGQIDAQAFNDIVSANNLWLRIGQTDWRSSQLNAAQAQMAKDSQIAADFYQFYANRPGGANEYVYPAARAYHDALVRVTGSATSSGSSSSGGSTSGGSASGGASGGGASGGGASGGGASSGASHGGVLVPLLIGFGVVALLKRG